MRGATHSFSVDLPEAIVAEAREFRAEHVADTENLPQAAKVPSCNGRIRHPISEVDRK